MTSQASAAQSSTTTAPDLSGFRVRITLNSIADIVDGIEQLPDHAIIFNAPRPLLGNHHWQGAFLSGRFYTAVYKFDEFVQSLVNENLKLDARVVRHVDTHTLKNMYLHSIESDRHDRFISIMRDPDFCLIKKHPAAFRKVNDLPYADFIALFEKATSQDLLAAA